MRKSGLRGTLLGIGALAALAFAGASQFMPADSPSVATYHAIDRGQLAAQLDGFQGQEFAVLISTRDHDYASVIETIEREGGTVTHQFKYARGLAATVPVSALKALRRHDDVMRVANDAIRNPAGSGSNGRSGKKQPGGERVPMGHWSLDDMEQVEALIRSGAGFDVESLHAYAPSSKVTLGPEQIELVGDELAPHTYLNPDVMNAPAVWASGNFGQDTIVAVIDSGVYGDHFMLQGSLIGCDDLSTDAGAPGCNDPSNNFHGSHVASTIAGHGAVLVNANDPLAKAIAQYSEPLPQASSLGFPGTRILPLFGIAPSAQIYGIKVFPASGGGASTSRIISAIEHAIDLKLVDGIDVDVINMSLGGGTTFDYYDLESQTVDAATGAGITVVTSAGNDGPASQTVGSPAGAHTAISSAAIAEPVHMRVFWDLNFGKPGIGHQTFVGDDPQLAYFSSRGLASNGQQKPALSATGVFVLAAFPSAGNPNGLAFSSGTSMASPGVAGTVALLNTWSENNGDLASPFDYREALLNGADPIPNYADWEQGAGYNNVGNALAALMADGSLGDSYPPLPPVPPAPVPPEGSDLGIVGAGMASFDINNLAPGHVKHYYFEVTEDTSKIVVNASNPRSGRDPYLLNSFEFHLSTGNRTYLDYYFTSGNIWNKLGPATFEVMDRSAIATGNATGHGANPMLLQPGYTRISVENDWTSAGPISGSFEVIVTDDPRPAPDYSESGDVMTGETDPIAPLFPCPMAMCSANLYWENNWTQYPTTDLDAITFGLNGAFNLVYIDFGAASLHSPETTSINRADPVWTIGNPDAVVYTVYDVDGFETHGVNEPYTFDWFAAPSP